MGLSVISWSVMCDLGLHVMLGDSVCATMRDGTTAAGTPSDYFNHKQSSHPNAQNLI